MNVGHSTFLRRAVTTPPHAQLAYALRRRHHGRYHSSSSSASATPPAAKTKKHSDPLRILFCGSDGFSCASLRALHREQVGGGGLVESVDVMVLPPRMTGRGNKQVKEVPCKSVAEELGLRIHQRETFRGWNLPEGTNLIVVVSFGLFVPPRILGSAKYGGLNVHPSLLPDLRGPAPIHRALLRGDRSIGISLQTLDPVAFDHGTVLAQTRPPGLPVPESTPIRQVIDALAASGAEMLVQGLRDGVHVPPYEDVGWARNEAVAEGDLIHAPKVTKADGQIRWGAWGYEDFHRKTRVLQSIWTHGVTDKGTAVKRVIFQDAIKVRPKQVIGIKNKDTLLFQEDNGGELHALKARLDPGSGNAYLKIADGAWMKVEKVKVDGKKEQRAAFGLKPFVQEDEGV